MNKRFSTLVATLLLSGALFTLNAEPVSLDGIKDKENIEWLKGDKGMTLKGNVVFNDQKNYLVIDKDNFVLDGNGKELTGHLVITGKNVTVKNLTINFNQTGDLGGIVNKTAITVIAPSVNLQNVKVKCDVVNADSEQKANGIAVFPTTKNAKLNINGNTITSVNTVGHQWNAAGIQIVEDFKLKYTQLPQEYWPLDGNNEKIEKSAILAETFDAAAILKDNKYEKCGTDFANVVLTGEDVDRTCKLIHITPYYSETGTLLNKQAVEALAMFKPAKDASLIFNGTANQLSAALKSEKLAENVVITTKNGNVSVLGSYQEVINTDSVYYTINATDKGLLSGNMDCVKDAAVNHEFLWSFGYKTNDKSWFRFQNAESGKELILPQLNRDNIFVLADKENTYSYAGQEFVVTPVEFRKQEDSYLTIEDEDLRAQIKGSGIGTSATRAEIIKKLVNIKYISLNKKTQVITPTQLGEMIFGVVHGSIKSLLNPELTASWELGLTQVAEGKITSEEYMKKLDDFVSRRTLAVKGLNNQYQMRACYDKAAQFYKKPVRKTGKTKK